MESLGQMTSAGRAAAPAPEPFQADSDMLKALRDDPDAWEGFLSAPALYRRIRIDNIQSYRAGKQLYRERLDKLIAASKERRLYGEWNDHERLTAFAHDYFLYTERIGFSFWSEIDLPEARLLWSAPEVTHYICASGRFTDEEVQERLKREISTYGDHGVQYWPLYRRSDNTASQRVLSKLGFQYVRDEYFEPTGLYQSYSVLSFGLTAPIMSIVPT